MDNGMKAKIERNLELAAALGILKSFTERPDFLGGPLEIDEAVNEIVRQRAYNVTYQELWNEFNRVRAS